MIVFLAWAKKVLFVAVMSVIWNFLRIFRRNSLRLNFYDWNSWDWQIRVVRWKSLGNFPLAEELQEGKLYMQTFVSSLQSCTLIWSLNLSDQKARKSRKIAAENIAIRQAKEKLSYEGFCYTNLSNGILFIFDGMRHSFFLFWSVESSWVSSRLVKLSIY